MRLTPLDIRKQEFSARVRGIDREEVQAFLQMVASQWEELLDDQRRLEDKVRDLDSKLQHYRNVEEALQEALRTARESSKEALETARQKAKVVVEEAEAKAADVNRAAKEERRRLKRQVSRLSSRHEEILNRLRTFLAAEMELLARFDRHDAIGLLTPISNDEPAPPESESASELQKAEDIRPEEDTGPAPLPPWAGFEGDDSEDEYPGMGAAQEDKNVGAVQEAETSAEDGATEDLGESSVVYGTGDSAPVADDRLFTAATSSNDEQADATGATRDESPLGVDAQHEKAQPDSPRQEASSEEADRPNARWISHRVFSAFRSTGRPVEEGDHSSAVAEESADSWVQDHENVHADETHRNEADEADEQLTISSEEVERIRRILKGLDHV